MSNLIPQLNRPPDVMRPVSVRAAARVAAGAPITPVTEVSASSSMPPVEFTEGDSLQTAFPSLAVITRRILNGMQEAMDRAIEDAAREAIDAQRVQAQADAAQQAERQAELEDALIALSESETPGSDGSQTQPQQGVAGSGAPATADGKPTAPDVKVVGEGSSTGSNGSTGFGGTSAGSGPGDDVALSRPAGPAERVDIGPGFGSKASVNREEAGRILTDVSKTVRAGPKVEVERVHRPENLAYSAMLLNG